MFETNKKYNVTQGTHKVTNDPDEILASVLGSCIAVCAVDPVLKIGGMNHILLPGQFSEIASTNEHMYAANLMELLLNDLFKLGATKQSLELKIFGGASVLETAINVGQNNIDFIMNFTQVENLTVKSSSLGGNLGRRVEFHPHSGKSRQKFLHGVDNTTTPAPIVKPDEGGSLELF
ncbi:MAG: chemotaxis protein CheD [Pseudomonadota bacterium]